MLGCLNVIYSRCHEILENSKANKPALKTGGKVRATVTKIFKSAGGVI